MLQDFTCIEENFWNSSVLTGPEGSAVKIMLIGGGGGCLPVTFNKIKAVYFW